MLDSYIGSMVISLLVLIPIAWLVIRRRSVVAAVGLLLLLPLFLSPYIVQFSAADIEQGIRPLAHPENMPPGSSLPFGSDGEGRDIWQTTWVGLANTFVITGLAVLVATVTGVLIGLLIASRNSLLSWLSDWVIEFFEAYPFVFFLLITMAAFRQYVMAGLVDDAAGLRVYFFGLMLGLIAMPYLGRMVGLLARQELRSPYVETLRGAAVSWRRIIGYNVLLNNILRSVIVQVSLLVGIIVLMNSAVDYILEIGFGDLGKTGVLTLGELLAQSRKAMIFEQGYSAVIAAIVCVLFSVLGSALLVEGLGDARTARGSYER